MRVFGLKSCDTCRKALKKLAEDGWQVQVTDVRADGLTEGDIRAIVAAFGDTAINRASTTWRGLSDADKDQTPEQLITAHPTLMKRPVIEHDGVWTIGWKPDVQAKWLGNS